MIIGSIMSILDTTIVNVALDRLGSELHTTLADIQWVITGYMLSLAAVIPVTGWAARRFGAKPVYLTSLVLFTAGSALCGFADSATELIVFRVIQGVGGGMILPIGQLMMARAAGPAAHGPRDEHRRGARDARADPRPDARRADPRQRELALDLLRQRAVGAIAFIAALRALPNADREDAGALDIRRARADGDRAAAPHLRARRDRRDGRVHRADKVFGPLVIGVGADRALHPARPRRDAAAARPAPLQARRRSPRRRSPCSAWAARSSAG